MKTMDDKNTDITFIAQVTFTLTSGPDMKSGILFLNFEDCCARLMRDDVEIGDVTGNIGGSLSVTLPDRRTFTAGPKELWNAVCSAIAPEHVLKE